MNEETVNQDTNVTENETPETPEKLFTQAELDNIIDKRFARMMEKFGDYDELKEKASKLDEIEEANKSELQKATEKAEKLQNELDSLKKAAEVRSIRDKVAQETGIPSALLTADSEDECKAQAEAILAFAKPNDYPSLKDNGEVVGTLKGSTKEQFAEWANKALN